jgi:DNA-binding GntR family transcriptional regulator
VVSTTHEDIADIYWAHAVVAGELTARACRKADPEFIAALADIQEQLEGLPRNDAGELGHVNNQFHRLINQRADAPKLLMFLRNTIRLIPERFYALVPDWRDVTIDGHRKIIEAIKEGNSRRAKVAAQSHVREAGALIAEHFSQMGYWAQPDSTDDAARNGSR